MKLKFFLVLTILLSSFSAFSHDRHGGYGRGGYGYGGYGHGGYGRGGYGRGGYGGYNDDADLLVLSSASLFLASTTGNELAHNKEQYVAVKSDAINFLAGEVETNSLKVIILKIRAENSQLSTDELTEEQIALSIISILQ